jgi:hypothetical protein
MHPANARLTQLDGIAERQAAEEMLDGVTGQASWPGERGSGQGARHLGLRFGVEGNGDYPARGLEMPECD